jgi:glutamine---fructose-6-phosphate transaminase (isomerizing)
MTSNDAIRRYQMLDYIHEGPTAIRRTLERSEEAVVHLVDKTRRAGIEKLVVTGVGSSWTAPMMAAPLINHYASLPVKFLPSTELLYYADEWLGPQTAVITVSRSGERKWVVDSLRMARERRSISVAVTAIEDSLLAQQADVTLLTHEGPEVTFAKTKSVLASAALLMRLGLAFAESSETASEQAEVLRTMPGHLERLINEVEESIRLSVPSLLDRDHVLLAGSLGNYGVALEGAMKLHEAAYLPSQADYLGNALHGAIGALDARWLAVVMYMENDLMLAHELTRLLRQFDVLCFCLGASPAGSEMACDFYQPLHLPDGPLLAPLLFLPPIQLLSYYWAVARGKNPDKPEYMRRVLDAMLPPGREEPELR